MRLKSQRGGAAVEFGLVLPLLALILFGIIEFALLFYNKQVITNASREGARYGIVMADPSMTAGQISTVVSNYCNNYLIGFPKATPAITSTVCPDPPRGMFGTNEVTVTVSYNYNFLAFPNLLALLGSESMSGPMILTASTVMKCE